MKQIAHTEKNTSECEERVSSTNDDLKGRLSGQNDGNSNDNFVSESVDHAFKLGTNCNESVAKTGILCIYHTIFFNTISLFFQVIL